MFDRLANGCELARQSWNVLKLDKELLLFPLLSGIACLMVLASFGIPLWNSPYAEAFFNEQQSPQDPIAYLILFLFYLVNYLVIVYFNAALVACAIIRFRGGDPTFAVGIQAANERLPQIFGWALVCATVGFLLRIIESRSQKTGQFVAGLIGMGWTAATYFVVPILVVEQLGPFAAVQRSLSVLKRTWGEALSANFGIGLFIFLATMPGIMMLVGGGFLLAGGSTAGGVVLLSLGVVWILLASLVSSALDAILLAAIYLYAADGEVPRQFDRDLLQHAFVHR
ncbi:hypothetical protein Mal4_53140 [Maioricimonas rarisocia]|uniref:Glycerophosphoryl diester phosphodiesterase membrane domain-containing protein n=1 Tax=Maioricimonas rarisocia TaxID=2528026 RepID=A0A517ZEQ5_9PLAN|nr:DUF6159 family protein [Maioricimonas rarisocia]QDU40951.1 hypothetical protein Mal4_53140 [Maioricimonas rarisocia]